MGKKRALMDRQILTMMTASHLRTGLPRTSDQPEAILEAEDRQHLEGEGLQTALAALDPRSRRVIEARYLTVDADGTAKPVTLQALAHELGVSAERVRQIEKLAIKKMGEKLAGQDPF